MDSSSDFQYCNDVEREYSRRVRADRNADHSEYLIKAVADAPDSEEQRHLQSTLVRELDRNSRYPEAEAILDTLTSSQGSGVAFLWSQFAEHYHYYNVNLPLALEKIERAVVESKRTNEFVYHNLGIKARIGIELRNWKAVQEALTDALAHRHQRGMPDVKPETDFLQRIPAGTVPTALINRYRMLAGHG